MKADNNLHNNLQPTKPTISYRIFMPCPLTLIPCHVPSPWAACELTLLSHYLGADSSGLRSAILCRLLGLGLRAVATISFTNGLSIGIHISLEELKAEMLVETDIRNTVFTTLYHYVFSFLIQYKI